MKKLFSLFLSAVIMFSLIPFENAMAYSTGDDYPSIYKNAANNTIVDEWNFYNRQCTSFVAWCLNSRNGVSFTNQYGGVSRWGNAKEWVNAAKSIGISVDTNPAVGAVAVWTSGTYGHVAWVKSVAGDTVTVEEYNWGVKGGYGQRTISKSAVSSYIHIKDISSNPTPPDLDPDLIVPPPDIVAESNIVGHLDKLSVTFNSVFTEGWATCRNHPNNQIAIHVHVDAHIEGFATSGHRPDADDHVEILWGISSADGLHGFANTVSAGNQAGKNATISVWGVCDGCSSGCLWVGQVYLPRGYTVSYNANGGSGAPSSAIKTENIDCILSTTIPKRTGYSFVGWSTSPNSTVAQYAAGATYTNNSAVTLYAVWKKRDYTITYDVNGGESVSKEYASVIHGNTADLSQTAYREGYTFCGWNTNPNATSGLNEITITQNTVVYAIWELNIINVDEVELNKSSIELMQGKTEELVATIKPSNATDKTIVWSSSNEAVATVESGVVIAISTGDAVVTAKVGEISDTCRVTVTEPVVEVAKVKLTVGSATGIKGQTVTVPVTVSENIGIAGFKFNLEYNNTVLTPVSIEKGSILSQGTLLSNIQQEDDLSSLKYLSAFWTNPADMEANGELLFVTFKISDEAEEGTFPISITYKQGDVTNQNYEDIGFDITNGAVTVTNVISGDIWIDGVANAKDGVRLAQVLAGWNITLNAYEQIAADFYPDGKINTKDSVSLGQYILNGGLAQTEMFELKNNSITFEAVNADVVDGYVDVPVMITENEGVAGFKITVNYNNDLLTPVSVIKGELLSTGTMTSNIDQGENPENLNSAVIFWSNYTDMKNTGVAFTVRFKVADGIGKTPITLSYEDGYICDQQCNENSVVLIDGVVSCEKTMDYTVKTLTGEVANNRFYAEAELVKNTNRDNNDMFIIALYKDGIMVDMVYMKADFAKGESVSFGGILEGEEGAVLKAFVWDSFSNMQPLSNIVENN